MTTARITVSLKKGVADPEGANTHKALKLLGFSSVMSVSTSKTFVVELSTEDRGEAEEVARKMCEQLLANPVIQSYTIEVL